MEEKKKRTSVWIQKNKQNLFEKKISQNAIVSVSCSIFQLITRFFIPPIVLHYVSIEIYGLWAYCFVFISYFGMSVMGITNVYVRYSAVYLVENEIQKINRLLSTGVVCALILSLFYLLGSWLFLPLSFPLLHIPQNLYGTAFFLIFGTMVIFSFDLVANIYKFLLHGLQKVGLQWVIQTVCQFLETILIVVFLYQGYGIFSLLYAYAVQIILSNTISAIACYRFIPNLSVKLNYFDLSVLRIFFQFGGIIQLRSMIGIINRSLTRALSSIFLGIGATALYDLGEKIPNTITSIPVTGLFVFLPANSHLYAKGEHQRINSLYLYGCRYMSLISGIMLGFVAPFSWVFIPFWLGPDPQYMTVAFILTCFAIPYHIMVVTGPASAVFRGINRPVIELIFGIGEIGASLIAVVLGFYFFGQGILAINLGIGSTILLTSGCYILYTNFYLKISQGLFFNKVIVAGLLPYFFASALAAVCFPWFSIITHDRWSAFFTLSLTFTFYAFLILPFYYFYILEPMERAYLKNGFLNQFNRLFFSKKNQLETPYLKTMNKSESIWENMAVNIRKEDL